MSIEFWIIIGLLALIVLGSMYHKGRVNALENERNDINEVAEDKEKRIQNLIEFKLPQEYKEGEAWKVVVIGDKYFLEVFRHGRPWETYAEEDADGLILIIKNLVGK